jgi:gliding motility-associated-like protein
MGNPTLYQHNGFTKGQHTAELTVQTEEGCISTPASKTLAVFEAPVIGMNAADACLNEAVNFTGTNLNPSVPVNLWNWNLGDGKKGSTSSVQHYYKAGGNYKVQLVAVSNDGCPSDTVIRMVTIYETHAYAGRDTIVADNQPVQLNASGGVNYSWSPRSGLSDANIPNPVAILQNDTRYILTAFAPIGCATTDTINIKVVKGPAFYVPNAFSPNNDGRNDRFRFIPIGMKEIYYFRVFNRQGQLVYFSKNTEPGWDGTVNGRLQSSGTFVWIVSGKDFNEKVHALKGTVILVR